MRSRLAIVATIACLGLTTFATQHPAAAAQGADPGGRLREVLGDEITQFQLVELDVTALAAALEAGRAALPAVTEEGELVELLLRLGRYRGAAVIHAAVVRATEVAPASGAAAEQLSTVDVTLRERLDPESLTEPSGLGRSMAPENVVSFALAEIDGVAEG